LKKRVLLSKPLHYVAQADEALRQKAEVIMSLAPTEEAMLPLVGDVHAIIAHGAGISAKMIQSAPHLEVISTPQIGFDRIDVAAATKAGIPVVTNAGLSPGTAAEFVMGLMIALTRHVVRADRDLRLKKNWSARLPYVEASQDMGIELRGATIGLVGLGSIGSTLAALLKAAFAARILAYDPWVSQEKMAAQKVEKREDLLAMAKEVDILSLHVALTPQTRHLIDESLLRAMKSRAYLVNCARGEIVDEKVLIKALQEQWIAGAAVDVFEDEPVSSQNPLFSLPNVITTPHIAGISIQSSEERIILVVKRLLAALAGEKPQGLANPEVWESYLQKLKKQK
jgi:phosphoglycerate dehydrogenase-like enzyme